MRSRAIAKVLWDIDKAASAANHDGRNGFCDGMMAAKKILLQAIEDEKKKRILRREKRRKNLAERA